MQSVKSQRKLLEQENTIKYEKTLYSIIFLSTLITVMNTSMFNVAIPVIIEVFGVTAQSASMIVSSYSIIFALSAILYSKFSDSVPIKEMLILGIVLLCTGSIIGMTASSYMGLIFARVVQAMGASSISALSLIITSKYIPSYRSGRKLGLVAAAITLGYGIGPLVGGVLTEFLGWRYLFGISLLSLVGIPFYFLLLPFEKRRKKEFDYLGMLYFFTVVVLFISTITYSWLLSPLIIVFTFLFIRHIKYHKIPFLQLSLLKDTSFQSITSVGFIIFYCNFSFLFLLPLALFKFFEMESPALIGLTLFPGALTAVVASITAGKAVDRIGAEWVAFTGILLMAIAGMTASLFGIISAFVMIIIFAFSASGFVCITASLPNILMKRLSTEQLSTGIGTLQLFQYVGGGIGVTITGMLLTYFEGKLTGYYPYTLVFGLLSLFALVALVIYLYRFKLFKIQIKSF